MALHDPAGAHGDLLRELNSERAAALMRISRTLESLIDQLHAAREAFAQLPAGERPAAARAYETLRAKAKEYRWYLEVQREAVGLRHHRGLDQFYAIPGPLDSAHAVMRADEPAGSSGDRDDPTTPPSPTAATRR